jgi:hypothetical protein
MALTCKLSQNILRTSNCGYSLPEIVDIYLANFDDVTETALSAETCGESVTGITMATGTTFYHIEPAKNSASFEDALVVEDNGNKYRTHTLTFNVTGSYTSCMHQNLDDLSLGKYIAVVKTAEGSYLMLGRIVGLEAETATLSGGGDTNGLQIVLSANVTESAIPVTGGAITTVVGQ